MEMTVVMCGHNHETRIKAAVCMTEWEREAGILTTDAWIIALDGRPSDWIVPSVRVSGTAVRWNACHRVEASA